MGRDPQILNNSVPENSGVIHHRHDGHFCVHIRKLIYQLVLVGHAVAQLVEALRYKSEGRGFDFH